MSKVDFKPFEVKGKVFEYQKKIVEEHLDTFGHVNNASYLIILEEARWEFITEGGFGLQAIQEKKIGPVILDLSLKFGKELINRETVTITTWVDGYINPLVGILKQEIRKTDGTVATSASFTIGLFDLQKRKLIKSTLEWFLAIGLSAEHHRQIYGE